MSFHVNRDCGGIGCGRIGREHNQILRRNYIKCHRHQQGAHLDSRRHCECFIQFEAYTSRTVTTVNVTLRIWLNGILII